MIHVFRMRALRRSASLFALLPVVACISVPMTSGHAADAAYFPATEFADLRAYEARLPSRFSSFLAAVDEPVLYNDRTTTYAIRLTIQTAFSGGIVIRAIEQGNEATFAHFSRYGRKIGDAPTPLIAQVILKLDKRGLQKLRGLVEKENFWTANNAQDVVGSDGSYWIVEVKDGDRYHVIYRWSPSGGAVFEIGSALMQITNVPFVDN